MTKVYPNSSSEPTLTSLSNPGEETVLTVWTKSLLFNCKGFTVFDRKGNLVFRVDCYAKGDIVLMDAVGKPLLTFRRKILSLGERWMVFDGEDDTNPRFCVKKLVQILQSKALAHVTPCAGGGSGGYVVEGSYSGRCCGVYDERRRRLAEIKRKEEVGGVGFGSDVFRLVVQPELDLTVAMAVVILLEQMFGSRGGSFIKG